jgi:putative membrane protein
MTTTEFFIVAWDPNAPALAGCAALLLGYGLAVRFRFPARAAAWLAAVLLILLAEVSPLAVLARQYLFSVHMADHILFVLVVPALLLLGTPAAPVEGWMRHPAFGRAERFLCRPAVAWPAGIGAMAFWHIPAVFHAAMEHPALHAAEPLSLLIAGTIYWWPILWPVPRSRLNPVPQAAAYLFTSCLACTTMGVLITFAPTLLYAHYAHPADLYGFLPVIRNDWGISAALDQQIGGLLMWVPGCLIYLSATMAMFGRWYAQPADAPIEA